MNAVKEIFHSFVDILAPLHCEICGKYIGESQHRFEYICNRCADRLPIAPDTHQLKSKLYDSFSKDDVAISDIYSLFSVKDDFKYMEPVHSLKYYGIRRIGYEFGIELGRLIKKRSDVDYKYIIPIPIHHARKRERGYNQSLMIAIGISRETGYRVNDNIVKRSRYTQTQTKLDSQDRIRNVSMVFQINSKATDEIKNAELLIVDDVMTTGSTLNFCANALLESGAKKVDAATLATA